MRAARVLCSGLAVALTASLVCASRALAAQSEPDLSQYDCTLPDQSKTTLSDQLVKDGYQIANRSRFGEVNLMMIKPGSEALVNCFKRQGAKN